jgi:hypothetical protein
MIRSAEARAARKRYKKMAPVLNEQSRRRFVALEARAMGHGGVSLMARITGLARRTIYRGLSDIRDDLSAAPGRIRKNGGGRKTKASQDRTLLLDLKRLVEPVTRGDPMRPLLWTCRSLRNLTKALAKKGHEVCPTVVSNLLHDMGYSLQANNKTREGDQHIDRDAQFEYINTQAVAFLTADEPVISVDTKKKELVGNFKNNGREWHRKGDPEAVNVHDFIDPKLRRAVPYGVYDINNNVGWVSVGTDRDTACFAVNVPVVAGDGQEAPSESQTSDDHRRWWRQQRLSCAFMESRAPEAVRRVEAPNHRFPLAARHQQVEQDRAPLVFVHHHQLAGQAIAKLPHDRPTDRRDDNRNRPQSARRIG